MNKYNLIIINILLFILLRMNISDNNKEMVKFKHSMNNKLKILELKNYLINQQFEAFYKYLYCIKNKSCIYQIIKPKAVFGKQKIRIGAHSDGGYILLNDFENIKFAYSFGISNETSFDKGLADKNIDVFMYDHTIEKLPYTNQKFHWKKIGLTEEEGKYNNMKTLPELIRENGHNNENNMILKLDIEGAEWNILTELNIYMKKFSKN